MTDRITTLWAAESADTKPPSTADLRARGEQIRARLRRRDAIEYTAALIVVAAFGWIALGAADWGIRTACTVLIAGTITLTINLRRRRPDPMPDTIGDAMLIHHRRTLANQRDHLASIWRWYLGPLIPGMILFELAIWRARIAAHGSPAAASTGLLVSTLIVAAVFYAIHRLNRRAAARLDRALAELDAAPACPEI